MGFHYIDLPLGTLSSTSHSDMAWGDYDGDGDLDLALGTDGQTVIYRNDSCNPVMTVTGLPGYWEDNDQAYFDLRSITWADYDNDGDPTCYSFSPGLYHVFLLEYRPDAERRPGFIRRMDLH